MSSTAPPPNHPARETPPHRRDQSPHHNIDEESGAASSPPRKRKRNRRAVSCLECRRRKKSCDGRVPGCGECLRRGVADQLCRWGDARDEQPPQHCLRRSHAASAGAAAIDVADRHRVGAAPGSGSAGTSRTSSPPPPPPSPHRFQRQKHPATHTVTPASPPFGAPHAAHTSHGSPRTYLGIPPILSHRPHPSPSDRLRSSSRLPPHGIHPSPANEQHASHSAANEDQLVDELAVADTGSLYPPSANIPTRSHPANGLPPQSPVRYALPSKEVGLELLSLYSRQLDLFSLSVPSEWPDNFDRYRQHYDPDRYDEMLATKPDLLAYYIAVFCLTIDLVPPTYALANTEMTRLRDKQRLLQDWVYRFLDAIDRCNISFTPTLVAAEALAIHQMHISGEISVNESTRLLDLLIRAARKLGLDRLGTHEQDVQLWQRQDAERVARRGESADGRADDSGGSHARASQNGFDAAKGGRMTELGSTISTYQSTVCPFAAESFRNRDVAARYKGRAVWTLIVTCDWARTRMTGYYLVSRDSFTSGYSMDKLAFCKGHEPEQERRDRYGAILIQVSDVVRRHFDTITQARITSVDVDYDAILALDDELQQLLDTRPEWLRFEDKKEEKLRRLQNAASASASSTSSPSDDTYATGSGPTGKPPAGTKDLVDMIMIISTIFNRIMTLHRPFISLGYRYPERYGRSVDRCLAGAKMFVKATMRCAEKGLLFTGLAHFHQRLFQVALVLVTHLLLSSSAPSGVSAHSRGNWPKDNPSVEDENEKRQKEELRIHEYLQFALNRMDKLDHSGVRTARLEQLLAACANLKRRKQQQQKEQQSQRQQRQMDRRDANEGRRLAREDAAARPGHGAADAEPYSSGIESAFTRRRLLADELPSAHGTAEDEAAARQSHNHLPAGLGSHDYNDSDTGDIHPYTNATVHEYGGRSDPSGLPTSTSSGMVPNGADFSSPSTSSKPTTPALFDPGVIQHLDASLLRLTELISDMPSSSFHNDVPWGHTSSSGAGWATGPIPGAGGAAAEPNILPGQLGAPYGGSIPTGQPDANLDGLWNEIFQVLGM